MKKKKYQIWGDCGKYSLSVGSHKWVCHESEKIQAQKKKIKKQSLKRGCRYEWARY